MNSVLNAIKASAVLIASLCIHPIFAQVEHVVKLCTGIMSLEAVDSYPQKLLEVIENNDTAVIVRITTFNEWEDVQTVENLRYAPYVANRIYGEKLQKYLKPTTFVLTHLSPQCHPKQILRHWSRQGNPGENEWIKYFWGTP